MKGLPANPALPNCIRRGVARSERGIYLCLKNRSGLIDQAEAVFSIALAATPATASSSFFGNHGPTCAQAAFVRHLQWRGLADRAWPRAFSPRRTALTRFISR
jgi:hypothetical protein